MLRLALQEALQGDLRLEAHLGLHTDIHQDTAILVPLADAVQITSAALIVDDEWRDLVPEAFLEHQQASNATIAIFKRTDALEADMEIQNLMEADIFLRFVLLEQLIDGSSLSIDCIAVENELAETWLDRRELDFLIYNEPESYVELILTGRMEEYLNTVREGQKF